MLTWSENAGLMQINRREAHLAVADVPTARRDGDATGLAVGNLEPARSIRRSGRPACCQRRIARAASFGGCARSSPVHGQPDDIHMPREIAGHVAFHV